VGNDAAPCIAAETFDEIAHRSTFIVA